MQSCTCLDTAVQGLSLKESLKAGLPHPGLPAPLPPGEHVVWQGASRWQSLARQVFHIDLIALYFVVLAAWRAFEIVGEGRPIGDAAIAVFLVAICGALVVGLLSLLAWFAARASIYTITNRRIVMRIGAALSKSVNIPFKVIESVQLKAGSNGIGNISIKLKRDATIPYFFMWPHVRPWHLRYPQPMLRAVVDVNDVAATLADLLDDAARADTGTIVPGAEQPAETAIQPEPISAPSPAAITARGARVPLMGAASLVLLALVVVGWVQLNKPTLDRTAAQSPQTVFDLSFRDLGSDRLAVVDIRRDETIAIVETGRDGLIRSAYRGLKRARKLSGLNTDAPYQLVIWDTGRMTLSDLGMNRHIPLDSFGPTDTGALAALLRLKKATSTEKSALNSAPASKTGTISAHTSSYR